jgi:hypothetical protein
MLIHPNPWVPKVVVSPVVSWPGMLKFSADVLMGYIIAHDPH